jgi:4-amino-4-deoxy-L-arabinose transferase-like glycosyltransferase
MTSSAPDRSKSYLYSLALAAILLLAVFMHFFRLQQEGFANLYYATAVKSMLTSWHNFFFVSFDPGGFVSVDKPPLGLWIQAISAFIFGFRGWSLLLPQALAGVLSVALLYFLVRRVFGPSAGLIAALVLTLTPVSVAANRNNTMDSLLVFTSLLAAWAATLAAERGRLRWLLVCAGLVGIGFNIKMLQAYLVLPAMFLIYFTAPLRWWKRILHLGLATLLLAIVSFSWAFIVDMTPPDQRPYVGSSQNNTVTELIAGHNGAARLGVIAQWLGLRRAPGPLPPGSQPGSVAAPGPQTLPQPPVSQPQAPQPNNPTQPGNLPVPGARDETGSPDPLRLFNRSLAGQISWLLPLALLCILPIAWQHKMSIPAHPEHQALLLWSIWLIPQIVFFSFAGLFHRYYLEMLAPAIAALVGAGLVAMRRDYNRWRSAGHAWRGWLLPLALLGSAVIQAIILIPFPEWERWLLPLAGGLSLAAASGLIILRLAELIKPKIDFSDSQAILAGWFTALGLLALLIAPAIWAAIPVWHGGDTGLPFAGPDLLDRPRSTGQAEFPRQDRLIEFLLRQQPEEKYILAVLNAHTAAPIIMATAEPVMALGGFSGSDPILTIEELAGYVAAGEVRFFLVPAPQVQLQNPQARPGIQPQAGQPGLQQPVPGNQRPGIQQPAPQNQQPEPQSALPRWIQRTCRPVPDQAWRAPVRPGAAAATGENLVLFDCKR